jgi:CCR4-NOT transcription complex subunit 4
VKSELAKPVKQYNNMDSLANGGEKTSACDVSPAPVNLNSELSSRPLSRDSDRGNCTIANTLNSTNITGHSFSSGHEEAVSATSEVIRNLSSEFSSINIGTSTSNEQYGLNKPSSPPIDHVLTKSQIQEGSQYDVDRIEDPITINVVGKTSTSDNGVFSPKEQFEGILNSQSQVVSDTADIEDDVTSFDNQRLKDPEVCLSYLPKATNFLNVSKLSSPSLMQYGEPCTAGNAGSLSSDDRVRDESILHSSSSMFCNGYPEKLISGSSNGLLHDERNRQSIGRLVGDAVNAGCDAAIDKGESSIISNILSIDFDPWNDSITSPHNIVKLLGDNTDSQPSPLKKSSSWKVQSNNQSRFSFARQEEESKIQTFDMHSSYAVSQQQPKSHTLNQNLAERDFYMDNLGIANGFPTSNFEEAENIGSVHSIASSNKLSREYYYLP